MNAGRPLFSARHALLLRAALHEDLDAARAAWRAWRPGVDFGDVDIGTLRALPLLADRADALELDDATRAQVKRLVRFSWVRLATLRRAVEPVLEELHAAGVPVMLLKGLGVVHHVAGRPAWRPVQDLDLLVGTEHVAATAQSIMRHGFASMLGDAIATHPAQFADFHSAAFTDARDCEIDLHWQGGHARLHPDVEARRWIGAEPTDVMGARCLAPAPEEALLQAIEHGSALSPDPPVRWAADVALLLRHGPALDWDRVVSDARARRSARLAAAALDIVEQTTAIAAPPEALRALRREPRTLAQRARHRRSAGDRPVPAGRAGAALEELERFVLAHRTDGRLRPTDVARAAAWQRGLPSTRELPRRIAHEALGRRRRWRDVLVPDDPRPASGPTRHDWSLTQFADPGDWAVNRAGFSHPDAVGMWLRGPYGLLVLPAAAVTGERAVLGLTWGGLALPAGLRPIEVDVDVDDVRVARLRLLPGDGDGHVERFEIAPGLLRGGDVTVAFRPSRTVAPCELNLSSDARRLSIWVGAIGLHLLDPSHLP